MATLADTLAARGLTPEQVREAIPLLPEQSRKAMALHMQNEAKLDTWRSDVIPVFRPLLAHARYKGAHGGRGSGKSHFFAEMLIQRAVTEPGLRAVCLRETLKSLRFSSKQVIEDKIQQFGFGKLFDVQDKLIGTPGGGVIIFQGMQNHTAESVKSLEGFKVAWFDEAQAASERSLELLRPTIRASGSEIWFGWNPESADDPVEKLLRAQPEDGDVVVEANYADNPLFPAELQREMERDRKRDPDKYAHIWLGRYRTNSDAQVFRNWKVEEFDTPLEAELKFGADWGFASDPTVLVRGWLRGRKLYIDHEAYEVGCEIDKTPQLFDTVPGSRKWRITADTSRPETISYMKRRGFDIAAALKGPGSLEDGVEFLKSFDIIVHPSCTHTIDELSAYSYKIDRHSDAVMPILDDRDNHVIDALRYALEGLRRSTPDFMTYSTDWDDDYQHKGANARTGY